jgi:hypothetical protein
LPHKYHSAFSIHQLKRSFTMGKLEDSLLGLEAGVSAVVTAVETKVAAVETAVAEDVAAVEQVVTVAAEDTAQLLREVVGDLVKSEQTLLENVKEKLGLL